MSDSTEELTARMAAGDEEAVEAFYRRYFDWLYLQARRATRRDEAFCLDVMQDAVLRIIRTVRCVNSEAQFRAWLRLVVQTTALDRLRSENRRTQREAVAATVAAAVRTANELESPQDELAGAEQQQWLREQIGRFDPQLVRMIELRYYRQWTLGRIAASLGLSIGTIDGRLRRAINDLRLRAVKDFGDEFDD